MILHLLESKPANERWAILVNEFGEIGIDGALLSGNHETVDGVFIKEVPGGCMCCTAGLPMQVALNGLLKQARPDRLLIEPTGLGHPAEVLETLSKAPFNDVLSIQRVITLVDARNLANERFTRNETFQQQIAIADMIVGNKSDLYTPNDSANLETYTQENSSPFASVITTQHGALDLADLGGHSETKSLLQHAHAHNHAHHHHDHEHSHSHETAIAETPIPEKGYLSVENRGEGFRSIGWRFDPKITFDLAKLQAFLNTLNADRIKGIFKTPSGVIGFNTTSDRLTEIPLKRAAESRIEIIATEIDVAWETALFGCINKQATSMGSGDLRKESSLRPNSRAL